MTTSKRDRAEELIGNNIPDLQRRMRERDRGLRDEIYSRQEMAEAVIINILCIFNGSDEESFSAIEEIHRMSRDLLDKTDHSDPVQEGFLRGLIEIEAAALKYRRNQLLAQVES